MYKLVLPIAASIVGWEVIRIFARSSIRATIRNRSIS